MDLQPMTTSYCHHSTLSLQNGKRFACFPLSQHTAFYFPPFFTGEYSVYPGDSHETHSLENLKKICLVPDIPLLFLNLCMNR